MRQRGKCGVTHRAQVPLPSFDMIAVGETSPRRMELLKRGSSRGLGVGETGVLRHPH